MNLKKQTLEFALNHLKKHPDTNIFPRPFEYDRISNNTICDIALKNINKWKIGEHRKCLIPKGKYGFRIATQIDPIDTVIYLSLILEAGSELEKVRASKDIVFSNRFNPNKNNFLILEPGNYYPFVDRSKDLAKKYKYVVVTDIADFFPRIYLHRLENSLDSLNPKGRNGQNKAIINLIKQWNNNVSYGIPVGTQASSFLSEIIIDDVDKFLLGEGIAFCRYADDYRLFCNSLKSAHYILYALANVLFENNGLTLQREKTEIIDSKSFIEKYVDDPITKNLKERFDDILLGDLGLDNPYEQIIYSELPAGIRRKINKMNLIDLFVAELDREKPDFKLIRRIIIIMSKTSRIEARFINLIIKNIEKLHPVFKDILEYIQSLPIISVTNKKILGNWLAGKLNNSFLGILDFHKLWILHTFSLDKDFINEVILRKVLNKSSDPFSNREIILALGKLGCPHWFRSKKRGIAAMSEWDKRAFLTCCGDCLPKDEYKHWKWSITKNLGKYDQDYLK